MLSIHLEQVHEPKSQHPAVAILDTRVLLFRLLPFASKALEDCNFDSAKFGSWCSANWALMLNKPIQWLRNQPAKGWQVVVVDDWKSEAHGNNYWRQAICEAEGLLRYKGNRSSDRPENYNLLHEKVLEYLGQEGCTIPLLREPGFEADDWAGSAWRAVQKLASEGLWKNREMYLVTSDGDWGQLVDDKHSIFFANVLGHAPRLRSEVEIMANSLRKGMLIADTGDLAREKARVGDWGDNIAPGSPISIVDLRDPPVKPNDELIYNLIKKPKRNVNDLHAKNAQGWLYANKLHCMDY